MASVSAAMMERVMLLFEKNPTLERNYCIWVERVNVTNCRTSVKKSKHIPGNGRFLYSAFSQFDNQIYSVLREPRRTIEGRRSRRMFPVTDLG